jgi:hypothetical protein
MASRDDLVYDEDDYVPPGYAPRKPSGGRTKSFVVLAVVGVVIGAAVLLLLMRSRERAQFARAQAARSSQNAVMTANRLATASRASAAADGENAAPEGNWQRLIGTWSRMPAAREPGYPHRLDIRPDRTATITGFDTNGKEVDHEVSLWIQAEEGETITLEARPVMMGTFLGAFYKVTFGPDGTLVLHGMREGIYFNRQK